MILHSLLIAESQTCAKTLTQLSDLVRHQHHFCWGAKFPERHLGLSKKNIIMVQKEMSV